MPLSRYPLLYQINTRVTLTDLSRLLGRSATLDDVPDAELDRLAALGFEWVWLLSVWTTGAAAQGISRSSKEWQQEFQQTLPDLRQEDIVGSGFAIREYIVHPNLGGPAALARLRARMRQRGLRLMLDFVPNHVAPDHPWINQDPDYFVHGSEADLMRSPQNYCRVETQAGPLLLAHGRDPFFDGWPDTLQLNFGNPELQHSMLGELMSIARQCDGVRCDMAMLILPEVFERTWNIRADPFWPKATEVVRREYPDFLFMAEVYWGLEWTLQQQGFHYTYDKRLYDRLREPHACEIREHLRAGMDYQDKLARFLENHDEQRAAVTFPPAVHMAAAVLTYLSPGLRFFHDGQIEGRRARISPHLGRRPDEPADHELQQFYSRLLAILRHPTMREGAWSLLECVRTWDGNETSDNFVAFRWQRQPHEWLVAVVNHSPRQSQCFIAMPLPALAGHTVRFQDLLSPVFYDRPGDDLLSRGLYIDVPGWGCHVFDMQWLA